MTDPRIEAAARALFLAHPLSNKEVVDACWDLYENEARAALTAADNAATITTVDELEALPVRSVILDECGESFQRLDMEGSAIWSSADLIASDLVELPARVIHWGTE